jgi:hypothetical protein
MQHNDDVVSGWLAGSESTYGYDNPAGPLYTEGYMATEAALTDPGMNMATLHGSTTCSLAGGCACC